ncbi:MAG: F0F1 ATP synthase subunit delta [Streptococcaceae bacterium]|jgi:F-type H+-transporting ATPase subunit delta|nr:F0F1 ATP synthase subunit delta [Streptococcaceae bacterium]
MKRDKKLAGKRYGKALFELAVKQDNTPIVLDELKNLRMIFQKVPKLRIVLTDNLLSIEQKEQIFSFLKGKSSQLVENFLGVLFKEKMMEIFFVVVDDFEKRFLKKEQKAKGIVITATALTDVQKEKLEQNVAKKLNFKSVKFLKKIDETIIGGVIIEVNQKVIDGSVKKELQKFQHLLNFR